MKKSDYLKEIERAENPYSFWLGEHPLTNPLNCDDKRLLNDDYIVFTDVEGKVEKKAFSMINQYIDKYNPDLIYTDEDQIDSETGKRKKPWLKPDWSPDTLDSFFYFGGLVILRKSFVVDITIGRESIRELLKQRNKKIVHIPEILFHSFSENNYHYDSSKQEESFQIEKRESVNKVSIIILSKDNCEMLEKCISSIKQYSDYENYEVIVVDNGSGEENHTKSEELSQELQFSYYYHPSEFEYSTLCNFGAAKATGDFLLFMNDDIEVTECNYFMQRMLYYAKKTHVGAVGIKLLYPETKLIQHVGITDLDVGPSHKLATYPDDKVYDRGRNRLNYNVLAVTGACLMIQRAKFEEVGGFDERIKVSYTDVDLCVDLYEKGYFNVVINECFLLHYESISRGNDIQNAKKRERLISEKKFFYQKHPFLKQTGDPFYHKYFSRNSLTYEIDYQMEWQKKDHFTTLTPVNEKKLVPWKSDSFRYSIDRVDLKMPEDENEMPVYEIEGWCFFSRKNNLRFQKELILVSENDQMQCSVISKYRKDLEDVFPGEKYIMMSGFVCKIPVSKLTEDVTYDVKVGLTSEWTGKCYMKETKWQIKNKKL